jgi:hypothetical protein
MTIIQGQQESALAHQLLRSLSSQKNEIVPLFYETYRAFFVPSKLRPLTVIEMNGKPQLVKINRLEAIEYLKKVYQFYDRNELSVVLNEAAREFNNG